MKLYTRTTIKAGPFNFNLSKSGVGVSVGVKGLRAGIGPRGNYVRIGGQKIVYRSTEQEIKEHQETSSDNCISPKSSHSSETHEKLKEIESADITKIVDSSSEEILRELNEKRKITKKWPYIAVMSVNLLIAMSFANAPNWLLLTTAALAVLVMFYAHSRDSLAKTTVLFYELEPDLEELYSEFLNSSETLKKCSKLWHIAAAGKVIDRKYHAGASNLVSRNITSVSTSEPPDLKTNIKTVAVGVGRQTLYFFPDRVLVYDINGVGAVSYNQLNIGISDTRFIEDEAVPNDARIIDHTWKYVNKSGGPDRRFKDNHQIPVCLYQEIYLTSKNGLNELIQLSKRGAGDRFARVIQQLSTKIPY